MKANARTLVLALAVAVAGGGVFLQPTLNSSARVRRPPPPEALEHPRLYAEDNPFAIPIPEDPALHPESDMLADRMAFVARRHGFILAQKSFSVTVFTADAETPRKDVRLTARWAPERWLRDVPIPDFARPDRSSDRHMVILDLVNRVEYDLWTARPLRRGRWRAGWANAISMDGDGIYPEGLSARGSGFALLQGVIWPDELAAGRIPHALIFSYSYVAAGGPVAPATESDGTVRRAFAMPEGARVQLDPDLDVGSLGLQPHELTIARAMQEFGMILADSGGGIELETVNPTSVSGAMYEGLLPNRRYVDLSAIPADRFRVLAYPE